MNNNPKAFLPDRVQGVLCQIELRQRMKPTFTQFHEPRCLVFGQNSCNQCTAKSKRSGSRCRAPAVKGKSVCRMHGGKSTGPRTEEGLLRSGRSRLTHGTQTRRARFEHKKAMLAIRALEESALFHRITWGPKMPGRKPS
jgi:hypothetical protein